MGAFDPTALARIRAMLAGLDELYRRREAALRKPALPGSLAAADDALPEARFVSVFAGHALASALDHLGAWKLLVNGPEIPFSAHLILMRVALEGAVRCLWLVDPKVDSGTRVGRGYAARRDDQDERRKFEALIDPAALRLGKHGKSAIQRLAELDDPAAVAAREAAGVKTARYTDTTALAATYGVEWWFRLSSALAHDKEWASGWTLALERGSEAHARPKVGQGDFSASETFALAMTEVTVVAVGGAVDQLVAYLTRRVTV